MENPVSNIQYPISKKTLSFLTKKLGFGLIWLLLGLGLFSCEPDPIEIDLPAHDPKLVIATQVFPDKYLAVQVSKSFSSLAGNGNDLSTDITFLKTLVVEHALVQIMFNGQTETLRHLRNGVYVSRRVPQHIQERYTLLVRDSVSGLECSAATEMLAPVTFESLEPEVHRSSKDTTVTLNFALQDPGPERNFFLISLVGANRKNLLPFSKVGAFNAVQEQMILVSDAVFTNGKYEGKEKLTLETSDTLVVSLSSISEPYYHYLKLYQKSGSLMNQLTGEPINLPTNIQNGFGFFSAHNPSVQVFKISDR